MEPFNDLERRVRGIDEKKKKRNQNLSNSACVKMCWLQSHHHHHENVIYIAGAHFFSLFFFSFDFVSFLSCFFHFAFSSDAKNIPLRRESISFFHLSLLSYEGAMLICVISRKCYCIAQKEKKKLKYILSLSTAASIAFAFLAKLYKFRHEFY